MDRTNETRKARAAWAWQWALLPGLLVAVALSGGCDTVYGIGVAPREGWYFMGAVEPRVEIASYKVDELGSRIQTTAAHPADTPLFGGQTVTNVQASRTVGSPVVMGKAGVGYADGNLDIRLTGGLGVRLNSLAGADDYREGLHHVRRQVNDPRGGTIGSFVYTQVYPERLSLIPALGVTARVAERVDVDLELGFPITEWHAQSGHDRFGQWQNVQNESDQVVGLRYSAGVGLDLTERLRFIVNGFAESHEPTFANQDARIVGWGGFVGLEFSW